MNHEPVLLEEVVEILAVKPSGIYLDCTLGDGGHAKRILELSEPDGQLVGFDADSESLVRARKCLSAYTDRVHLLHGNFSELEQMMDELGIGEVDGILIDLGWSSPQFSDRGRGFSFDVDEPLDMRYDAESQSLTAADVLNDRDRSQIEMILSTYADERFAIDITRAIVRYRNLQPIRTSRELVGIVNGVYREKLRSDKEVPWIGGTHPATKTFQALRMAVNDELGVIERVIPQAVDRLKSGGRLAIITFHSVEDRLVKHMLKKMYGRQVEPVSRKPIVANEEEVKRNPRSRSAKMRVVQKI
jgi:16S rRNA (cytosine1402-N4)-methyltransferase